jgi:hypothetical protein
VEDSGHDGGPGLRRNVIGFPGLVAQPLDVTAPAPERAGIYRIGDEHTRVGPGSIMLIPALVEHYIEPLGAEVVESIDVFAPAHEDYLHLLRWMR